VTALISSFAFLMLQNQDGGGGGAAGAAAGAVGGLIGLGVGLVLIIAEWKIFVKAGEPGWACLVPIYNLIVLLKIAGKPIWWFLILWLVIPWFLLNFSLARKFGKGAGFGLGLSLLPPIFYLLLGFGDARYNPAA